MTVVTVLLLLLMSVGFEVGIRLVSPDAVQVSTSSVANGHTLATRTITDVRIVADLYARINHLPFAAVGGRYDCTLSSPDAVTYGFRFTRWGIPVEVAILPRQGCYEWLVSRGGIPESRVDRDGETQAIRLEVQPLVFPP